uniref:AP-4 complex subunit epsilon n=1 Tax=Poecilia latipinna TaxID=48699 RepID=A0A3B3U1E7_9TELE
MKELMVRAIYCEMLGYGVSFSYIHAIKLAQQGNVLEKRVGVFSVILLHDTNLIEVCMALTVVSQMFPKDMIPAILPLVEEKLNHPKEIIRRKAVLALYKFYLIAPNQVQHIHNKFRKALCDKDPGVMSASLHIYLQLIQENPEGYKDLAPSFVTILKQVVGGKLPMDFNYHSVPAPWLQIHLLRILSLLGKNDQSTSEIMYEILDESLRRAEMNHNITYEDTFLLKAAKCIGNFVLSPKINLKYLGLKALTYVVQQDPKLALQHQMTIIECLDHSDLIIKRETLELLFRITNDQNVTVIVEKMLDFLRISEDDHTTIDLVGKVAELAEKYPYKYNEWFIDTMNTVFSLGGDLLQPDIPNSFLKLLSEGDVEEDKKLRLFAVNSYISLLQGDSSKLPQRFLQVICWVLGEYSHLREDLEPGVVVRLLAKLLDMKSSSSETKCWVLMAMTKLCPGGAALALVHDVSETYSSSLDTMLRQRAQELQILSQDSELQAKVLPRSASMEPVEVDSSLSFLDGFVSEALAAGAAPYKPPHQRQEELSRSKALNLEPYGLSLPISISSCSITDRQSPTLLSISSGLSGDSTDFSHKGSRTGYNSTALKLDGVKRLWGRDGYLAQKEQTEEAPRIEAASAVRSADQLGDNNALNSQTPNPTPSPECDQEKQQLASSLFVGLASQSTVSSGSAEQITDPLVSPSDGSDNLLYKSLLDSLDLDVSPPEQTAGLVAPNGSCDAEEEPADADVKEIETPPVRDERVTAEASPHDDPDGSKDPSLASHLPAELSALSHSKVTLLFSKQNLDVSACHVQKEDSVVLVVFISNCSDSFLHQIRLQVDSEELEVRHATENLKISSFSLIVSCRALRLSTEEYGAMWLAFSHDTKQNLTLIHDGRDPLAATLDVLKRKLQLHVVEIIGVEAIVACCLQQDQPCLMHCRMHAGMLAVWLRSPVPDLPDCLLYCCQRALQEL